MVSVVGDSDLSRAPSQLPVPARPGLVVAAPRPAEKGSRRPSVSDFLPFVLTLLAGGIVVAIVALALSGASRQSASAVPLPPPSASATPAPSVGTGAGQHHPTH